MIVTQRIFWPSYNSEKKLSDVLKFLRDNRSLCDEISFFTEGDGLDWRYLPRAEVAVRAEFLAIAVQAARAGGFVTAINILNTIGHSDEGGEVAPDVPWQGIVGHDGMVSRKCSCPAAPEFLKYVESKYEAFARCGADLYWIDDDVRLTYHSPVEWGCFCETCLVNFSARIGRQFSRTELVEVLCRETSVRGEWVARNNDVIKRVLGACAQGVRTGNPTAGIGFMICDIADLNDCGVDLHQWFGELSSHIRGPLWLRPGGGFWNDSNPRAVLTKIHAVSNSIDAVPPEVRATYEVENYPFILGDKSAAQTGLECLLAILSSKLDGVMLDVLDPAGNDLAAFSQWTNDLSEWRPIWERAAELVQHTTPLGWKPTYSSRHFEQCRWADLNSMRRIAYQEPLALQTVGLPMTGFSEGALGHVLCGSAALGMNADELRALLQKPLLMDGAAARIFLAEGLGAEIGIEQVTEYGEGIYEEFSDHALNGRARGYKRSVTLRYFGERSHALEISSHAQALSVLRATDGSDLGAALALYEKPNGAPVAIVGHLPFRFASSPQRMEQLQNLSRHMIGLSPLKSSSPVVVWWRAGDKKTFAVLFNAGFDTARRLVVPAGGTVAWASPGSTFDSEQGSLSLQAWSVAVIQWEQAAIRE